MCIHYKRKLKRTSLVAYKAVEEMAGHEFYSCFADTHLPKNKVLDAEAPEYRIDASNTKVDYSKRSIGLFHCYRTLKDAVHAYPGHTIVEVKLTGVIYSGKAYSNNYLEPNPRCVRAARFMEILRKVPRKEKLKYLSEY